MLYQQLMSYFKFERADLDANRNGGFTDKQRLRLVQQDKSSRTWGLIGGTFLVVIGAVGLAGAIAAVLANPDRGFWIGFGLGFGCIWPLVWGGLGFVVVKNALSKHQMKLARVQGVANIVRSESYSGEHHTTSVYHELQIGGQEFSVQEDLPDVIMQGQQYIHYYVDGTDEIVSAEAVGN